MGKAMQRIDETYIKDNFGTIWPAHVETLTWFLIECRRHFGGDLDRFLVLCVIGDRTLSRGKAPAGLKYEEMMAASWIPNEPEALNTRSVADFSGIPRETVRRKVLELIDLGWVERDENGYLRATRKAAVDLAPLTDTSFQYIARMAKTLASV